MDSATYSLPALRQMDLLGIVVSILFLFSALTLFAFKMISGPSGRPQRPRPIKLDGTTSSHPYEGDSGYESSDDEDIDGIGRLCKALRMVDDTLDPRESSARRHGDDFQVFANFASANQRRAMRGEELED